MCAKILVVDDEKDIRLSLRGVLEDEGHSVVEAESGEEALGLLEREAPELVFLDVWLPGKDGLEVLGEMRESGFSGPVIVISGHGNIETAVTAIKGGAFDFIEKPLSLDKVVINVENALKLNDLRLENIALRSRVESESAPRISGSSRVVVSLRTQIEQVAPTDAWVLVTGENGTGKEIVARLIHAGSRRSARPMIAVNCAAIPEELIESELFGHEKGAFTGAERAQEGKFELANGGTLFLDEIGDMSLKTQAKILRILQEQRFERVGGRKTIKVDVRVMAATNKNLPEEIKAGRFREDLYYRLKVFPIEVPPLRSRAEDIPILAEEFMAHYTARQGLRPLRFAPEALTVLARYPWPGNVRELKNFVERMMILHSGQIVDVDRLPPEFRSMAATDTTPTETSFTTADFKTARAEFEAKFLEHKLQEYQGNITRLAEAIGLERSYLYRKLKAYGINVAE